MANNGGLPVITEEVFKAYQELKYDETIRFYTLKISDDFERVEVDYKGPPEATFYDFQKALPHNDCRYGFFDFEYEQDEELRSKVLKVCWAPDESRIRSKMRYASAKDMVWKRAIGVGVEIAATDLSEIDRETVLEKVLRVYY